MSEVQTQYSVGQEIMRTTHSGNPIVKEWKEKYAKLFDEIVELVGQAQIDIDTPPGIYSPETIKSHMEVVRRKEDAIRCYSEASKILETSCMYLIKGITS